MNKSCATCIKQPEGDFWNTLTCTLDNLMVHSISPATAAQRRQQRSRFEKGFELARTSTANGNDDDDGIGTIGEIIYQEYQIPFYRIWGSSGNRRGYSTVP
jgi:hypothetical protein